MIMIELMLFVPNCLIIAVMPLCSLNMVWRRWLLPLLISLGVGAFTLYGEPEIRADGHSSPRQAVSDRRGILEVDPASGAVSLYVPLGPGIGRTGLRYNPALVGRFAPQVGHSDGGEGGRESVLLATTAFELSPGVLDLPLAGAGGYERTEAPLVARWTYPDGTGGSSIGVNASGLDPRSIMSRFGHCPSVESGCLPRRTSDPPSPPVIQGSAGEFLLTLFDETRWPAKQVAFAGDRDPWMVPSCVLAVRGDLAYEYSFAGSWKRASQPVEAYAHYRLSSIRSTTGEAMSFTYGENGVDFEAEWEATRLRVTLAGLEVARPVPALDACSLGMGPETPDRACRDVGARLRLTYEGTQAGPGYTIIAMVRPEGPASQAPTLASPVDSFRSNLQVSLIQADGSEEAVQFQYENAPSPEASGEPAFAVTVLRELTLPGRRVRLELRR